MLGNRNLVIDTFSEVYNLMKPWMTHDFWDFASHEIVANSIYIISRKQFFEYPEKIQTLLSRSDLIVFFDNAAEGSWTLISQLQALGLKELALDKKLFLISGGDIESSYVHVQFEHFLCSILRFEENAQATEHIDNIFQKTVKPYKFLFLNGRARPHRKYLFERFRQDHLLDTAIWTMLDSRPSISRSFKLEKDGINLMAIASPLKWLPKEYEYQTYRENNITPGPADRTFVKHELFNNEWGEIYLEPAPYIDTYFSLITETVFEYPYSFRTEKIAKPLAIGHPFIVAANTGFYRDLRNLGFRTFDNVIDESFDLIENHQDRMDRVFEIVKDLCQQDLQSFLAECYNSCKYNQQHLVELVPQLRRQFPETFFKIINQHG